MLYKSVYQLTNISSCTPILSAAWFAFIIIIIVMIMSVLVYIMK